MIRRWLSGLVARSVLGPGRLGVRDDPLQDEASARQLEPEIAAARFLADPDHYVAASIGERHIGPECSGRQRFRIEVVVSGLTIASVRGGTLYVAHDGERTAEIFHYEIGDRFRGLGVAVPAARSIFRHLHTRHRVTRILFVSPVVIRQRAAFRAFVERIGAEPYGHFADDPVAPPLFAWSARKAFV
jgi:hypothetical protein